MPSGRSLRFVFLPAVFDDPGRHTDRHRIVRDGMSDNCAGTYNTVSAHISKNDSGAADPGPLANANKRPLTRLVTHRTIQTARAMGVGAARDMYGPRQHDVTLEMDKTKVTPRTDVDVSIESGAGLAENGTELDA
jgi:hypothetical protein